MTIQEDIEAAVNFRGLRVPASPSLHARRAQAIRAGRYRADLLTGALHLTGPGDRVLELGAGIGFVSGAVALLSRARVLTFEPNPRLIPSALRLYEMNRLDGRIELRNAALRAARQPGPGDAIYETVAEEFRPDLMILGIGGGEREFLRYADLGGLRAIIVAFSPAAYGTVGLQQARAILRDTGFRPLPDLSSARHWTAVRG